jgi:hypothetical protein
LVQPKFDGQIFIDSNSICDIFAHYFESSYFSHSSSSIAPHFANPDNLSTSRISADEASAAVKRLETSKGTASDGVLSFVTKGFFYIFFQLLFYIFNLLFLLDKISCYPCLQKKGSSFVVSKDRPKSLQNYIYNRLPYFSEIRLMLLNMGSSTSLVTYAVCKHTGFTNAFDVVPHPLSLTNFAAILPASDLISSL